MAGKQLMKSGAFTALAVALAATALPAAASAQDDGGRHGGERGSNWRGSNSGDRGGDRGESRSGENRGGGDRGGWQRQQQAPAPQVQAQPAPRAEGQRYGRDWNNGGVVNRPDAAWRNRAAPQAQQAPQQREQRTYADAWRNRSYAPREQGWDGNRDGRRWDGDRRGDRRWDGNRTGGWNRDWRRDNRYSWQSYRNQNRQLYRAGRYYSPYNNWSYRRLSIGFFLQPLFFSQNYWIDDPWMYRLPEAYGPYRWVRYYDDALLVNIYNGEVVDVIYDFFW